MWFAIWLFGAGFIGLMWGIWIALSNVDVKWSDAMSAIGTVVAAVGTVGTLAFQAFQNAKLQRQQRVQALIQDHAEAELVSQWFHHFRLLTNHASVITPDARAAAFTQRWREDIENFLAEIKRESSRIMSVTGHGLFRTLMYYVDGLERVSVMFEQSTSLWDREFLQKTLLKQLQDESSNLENQVREWRSDIERDLIQARSERDKVRRPFFRR